jgi:hypothetical protein
MFNEEKAAIFAAFFWGEYAEKSMAIVWCNKKG